MNYYRVGGCDDFLMEGVCHHAWRFPERLALPFVPCTYAVSQVRAVPFMKQTRIDLLIANVGEMSEDMVERKVMEMNYSPILHHMENLLIMIKSVIADLINGSVRRADFPVELTQWKNPIGRARC